MLAMLVLCAAGTLAAQPGSLTLKEMIAQMLVVNVDGFSYRGPLAVHPAFMEMAGKLQVGGVIPHYGNTDPEKIRATNRALEALTQLPLLVCADGVDLRGAPGQEAARFGDRYIGGFIGRYKKLSDGDFRALAALNAFTLAAIGVNTLLGPTVDDSTGDPRTAERAEALLEELEWFGIQPVIKHFPFLPQGADLHLESPDTRVPAEEMEKRTAVFRPLAQASPFLMTTHLLDSLVSRDLVTFSPQWRQILNRETGFKGLVMSDALLMLSHYRDVSILGEQGPRRGGEGNGTDPARLAQWAAKAIMAGHDLLIVEGNPEVTYSLVDSLLAAAQAQDGSALRKRIEESAARVVAFKEAHRAVLTRQVDAGLESIRTSAALALRAMYSSEPRLDGGALFTLRAAFQKAAAK